MIRAATIEEAHSVLLQVPELDGHLLLEEMNKRLGNDSLVVVADVDGDLAGVKIGYPECNVEFYSWLGGVVPKHRNSGIAQMLLEYQEVWAKNSGYKRISVKSMNRFPSMLRLLIKNNYQIAAIENSGNPDTEKILFTKQLDRNLLSNPA